MGGGKQLTLASFFGPSASSKANTPASQRDCHSPAAPAPSDGQKENNPITSQPLTQRCSDVTPEKREWITPDPHLCDYEQQREARIARNKAVLHSLGLLEEANMLAQTMRSGRPPKPPPKRKRPLAQHPVLRRSTRSTAAAKEPAAQEQPQHVPATAYEPSVAASYVCEQIQALDDDLSFDPECATGVNLLGRRYECRALSRIYR